MQTWLSKQAALYLNAGKHLTDGQPFSGIVAPLLNRFWLRFFFHGRTSWQLEKVNLSIFVVYCDVCLVAKFRINPTAFCVNVSPSTFPVVREIFLRLLVAERYSICLYIKMLSGSLPTKGCFLAIEFVFR